MGSWRARCYGDSLSNCTFEFGVLEFLFATQQHRASLSRNQKAKPTTEARRRGENQRNYSCRQNQVVRLIEAAVKIIEEYNLMKLTAAEWKILIELLLNPPAPNEALRLATKRY